MLEDILSQVHKPGRYIGGEWNISKKKFDTAEIKFALAFADLYEIGMSNLGVRIIYGILNSIEDVVCERVFACNQDMEDALRANRMELFSLESGKRLKEFDMIGFSLGYELNYTNVLQMLELGGIPLVSGLRDHTLPLVIGGGPCTLNPEPMHEFFDLFVIGEAEEALLEIIDTYRRYKDRFKRCQIEKRDLLIALSGIEGVYVPSLYEARYTAKGSLEEFRPVVKGVPLKITKRFVKDLGSSFFPVDWIVPYIEIIHDRITLEIMRGCPNRCRFCQARAQYFPYRQRSTEKIVSLGKEIYERTGYEEMSLCGLSVSDYAGIEGLLAQLVAIFKEKGVSISLPSIKPRMMVGGLSTLIATIKKTGLTFAPEAATERLRRVLGKNFDVDDFKKVLQQAYAAGYQHIKLYFMTGLPQETDEDLDALLDFASSASALRREAKPADAALGKFRQGPAYINLSINTLIPKPHTALQWFPMEGLDSMERKQHYLRQKAGKNKRIKLNLHNAKMSFLEGVLSRGDRRLSAVILSAFAKGARFDAWSNYFSFEKWMEAFRESHIDPYYYLQEKPRDEILPWDFLEVGVDKKSLIAEFDDLRSI